MTTRKLCLSVPRRKHSTIGSLARYLSHPEPNVQNQNYLNARKCKDEFSQLEATRVVVQEGGCASEQSQARLVKAFASAAWLVLFVKF